MKKSSFPSPGGRAALLTLALVGGIAATSIISDFQGLIELRLGINGCHLIIDGRQTIQSNPPK